MVMALLKYFKQVDSKEEGGTLPDPAGPLSKTVPSTSIEEANKEVTVALAERKDKRRLPYLIFSLEQKARIGKYAADQETTNAMRHFSKDFPNLRESTVRGWKSVYLKEVSKQVKAGVKEISVK